MVLDCIDSLKFFQQRTLRVTLVSFFKNLRFNEHIDKTANKVNRIMGFSNMDKNPFLTFYKYLARSHLDYRNLVFNPITVQRNVNKFWKTSMQRCTFGSPELNGITYKKRLS